MPKTASYELLSDNSDEEDYINSPSDDEDSDFDFDHAPSSAPVKTSKSTTSTAATKKKTKGASASAPASKAKSKSKTSKGSKKKQAISIDLENDNDDSDGDEIDDDLFMESGTKRPVLAERCMNSSEESEMASSSTSKTTKKKKTVEEKYQKLTQLEHILVRPDTYIGSVERSTQEMYVLSTNAEGESEIIEKEITYTPGLYKIFDEILVNAADNKQRDPNMDKLEIVIKAEENLISVKNNGKGIPIEFHKDEKCYVPTLVFGHLLTGSNFDDNEKKTTGGRNGYGAKLANIFSTKFIVECADTTNNKKFRQVFTDNMKKMDKPVIKDLTAAEQKRGDFVKITFSPDLEKFKMTSLDEDIVALFSKRAYDIAGSMARAEGKKLNVTLNGNKVSVRKFEQYLKLYRDFEPPVAYEDDGVRWEVGVGVSDGTFKQVSFVNSICTSKGGEHVNHIASLVAKKVSEKLKKKKKDMKITENQIKNYLTIFVNCLIENPSFDSQTKETLTTKKAKFGSKCELSTKFLNKIEKSSVVEKIINFAAFKERQKLGKKSGTKKIKLTGILKLDDANFAGSAKSKDCTLILTEGDSAKSLAMSGVSVVGRDYYGVFPLKGKPLNVRDANLSQVNKNEEIKNIIDILGLKFGVEYNETNIKTLRYGHLMIMADQDHDGSHIKGLIINFFHHYWPSLLNVPGFLQQFITPIVKATRNKQSKTFFTMPEYENWKESTGNDAKGWKVKYYKGLGTSTSAEAKQYFSNLNLHEIHFCELSKDECKIVSPSIEADPRAELDASMEIIADQVKSGEDMIELAFSKKKVEERKGWLSNIEKNTYLDYSLAQNTGVKFSDFINKELILFSQADTIRSIPNVYDGFKPSQRKVLFGCFLKNLKNEMKVAQLCGYIGEKSAYHHGEASLQGTIVNMAQDFIGSNNINLLTPSGQFGTRRMGGKDSASPRYIFTKLEKITRAIFHPDDDPLLNYLHEDGESIEPEFYMPTIPMVLVNGADGIGTGWSTSIPNYNPRDIIKNIRRKLDGEEMTQMHPYYFGFNGSIEGDTTKQGSYVVSGKIERVDDETLRITELPIKVWTQDYKIFIEKMMTGDEKKKIDAEIKDFKENHTDTTVSFTITATKEMIDKFEKDKDGLHGKFKLRNRLNTSNMNVFDKHGRIVKYASVGKLMESFYEERLDYYVLRKEHLLKQLRREQRMLSNKARFVEEVCSGDLIVSNRKRKEILTELKDRGYEVFQKVTNNMKPQEEETSDEDDQDENESDAELAKGYEYLLGMKIWSLTFEKAEKLRKELAEKTKAVADLEATSPEQLWKNDLIALEEALDDRDDAYAAALEEEIKAQGKNKKHQGAKAKRKRQTKIKTVKKSRDDDSDEEFQIGKKKSKSATTKPKAKSSNKEVIDLDFHSGSTSSSTSASVSASASASASASSSTSSFDLDDKSDESLAASKPKSTKSAGKKPTKAKQVSKASAKSKTPAIEIDSDSEDESMTLFDRMKAKTSATKSSPPSSATSRTKGKKRASPKSSSDEDLDSFDMSSYEPAALTPAPKKTKTSRKSKKKIIEVDDDDDDDIFDEIEKSSSDEEDVVALKPRSRPTRGRKAIKYNDFSDDESDSDDEFDFNE